jgi:hypothetical protein
MHARPNEQSRFKCIETPTDHVNAAFVGNATDMISGARQRFLATPLIGFGVVNLMPPDTGPFVCGRGGAADQVNFAIQ